MSWRFISLDEARPQPWRNGGGVTRELLAWPSAEPWNTRWSIADVRAAGPFSRFEATERWFAVLEGAGVLLRVDGVEHRLTTASEPFRFDGGAAVDCGLVQGATRDFNLMARPGTARMQRVRGEHLFAADGPLLLAAYAHRTNGVLVVDGQVTQLAAGQLAWQLVERPCTGSVAGEDLLWMEAQP